MSCIAKEGQRTVIETLCNYFSNCNFIFTIRSLSIAVTEEEVARQSITEETGKEDDQPVTSEIGKDGGSLVYDESLSITIPPMTFTKSTNITLKPTDKDETVAPKGI